MAELSKSLLTTTLWIGGCVLLSTPSYGQALSDVETQETRAEESSEQDTHIQNTTVNTQTRRFDPDYFTVFAPVTALEMVERIPGFQIELGDSGRGLGQGGANILINAKRVSGKSNNPRDHLSRIAARNVVFIDIVDGASLNIPGLSGQVVNVTTASTGITGTWEWNPQFRKNIQTNWWRGNASVLGEIGDLSYTLTFENNASRRGARGPEDVIAADGTIFEVRQEDDIRSSDRPSVVANLTWTPREGHTGNLNVEAVQFDFNSRENSQATALTDRGITQETVFSRAEDEWNTEIGADYEWPLAFGQMKFIGLYRFESSPSVSRFDVFDPIAGQTEGSRFFQDADETEAIVRSEFSWTPKGGADTNQSWQIGLEGAFNVLDFESQLFELSDQSVFIEAVLDDPDTRVEERRAEATLTHSRALSPRWDLQASLGVEYSELSQSGTSELMREFVRPKGFITATYKPDDKTNVRFRIDREVGQLNFFDFTSSVSLQDNLDRTGNPDLVPSQSWLGEIEFDKSFNYGHTFTLRTYGELISDLVDRIPIGVDGDAVGNIDSASRYGFDVNATLKGEQWGWNGTQLDLAFEWRDSSVDDPLTGIARRLNRDKRTFFNIEFRHDIPNSDWVYGFFSDRFLQTEVFRLDTTQNFRTTRPFTGVFIEHKDIVGLKVRATLLNILDIGERFERSFFDNRRDIGALDFTEQRTRRLKPFLRLNVSGTF